MKLPQARPGGPVNILKREVPFSFWPVVPGSGGAYQRRPMIYASDPWLIIRKAVRSKCPAASLAEALACLDQSQDFFAAATTAEIVAARPLALYYSFMNLSKALCLMKGIRATYDQAKHGLSERLDATRIELLGAYLDAYPSGTSTNNFDDLKVALTGASLTVSPTVLKLPELLPQVVPGHRLWVEASNQDERFVPIDEITFMTDGDQAWVNLYFDREDLTRLGLNQTNLILHAGLNGLFTSVQSGDPDFHCLQQNAPVAHGKHPGSVLLDIVRPLRPLLWPVVTSTSPYRRYYVYLAPGGNRASVVHQLLSIYAITFYLGSITRYRPHHYDTITEGAFGAQVQEFVTQQPLQFLYLMASEFMEQDVSRSSIVV
ncbi:MAG: YaaC family protein [Flavobacteriales bacterium]|nr:YaaC family protein [Flavobacteriales bacterium]